MKRFAIFLLVYCYASAAFAAFAIFQTYNNSGATNGAFAQLAIGGGGYVTNQVIASDGTEFARTDTAGAFYRSSHTAKWVPVLTAYSMPSADQYVGNNFGVCEVAIAPANTSHFYMYYAPNGNPATSSHIYSSTNSGGAWARAGDATFPTTDVCPANDQGNPSYRLNGPYMAVSPVSPGGNDVIYVGTHATGVWYSLNSGSTWTQISTATIPAGGSAGDTNQGNLIFFDPTDATGNTVYITSYGTGIWKCTAALTSPSCSELNSTGMPTTFKALLVDPLGTVWVVDNTTGNGGKVLRYLSGTWSTQLTVSSNQWTSVAVDPASTSNVYAARTDGVLEYTTNGQAGTPTWALTTGFSTVSTVIPWQQWKADSFLSLNSLVFDPSQSHVLYGANGDGTYKLTPPTSGTAAITWNADETAGIENLDFQASSIPLSGGGLGFAAQDRPAWFMASPNVYPSQYYPNNNTIIRLGISVCGNPAANTYGNINESNGLSVSTSGYGGSYTVSGQTGLPAGFNAGQCIALTSANWIWLGHASLSISSGSYNSSTGVVTLTLSSSATNWASGDAITVNPSCTSTCPGGLSGSFAAASVSGATVTYNAGTGHGAATINGGSISLQSVSPYFTNNSGTGWSPCTGGSAKGGGWVTMAQDSAGNVVLYNDGTGATNGAGAAGSWESSSSTACAFTQNSTTKPDSFVTILLPVPGHSCNFVFASHAYIWGGLPGTGNIYLTTDCGTTWSSAISGINSVIAMGIGIAQAGHDGYASLYYQGWYNNGTTNAFGLWEVDNIDSTPVFTDLDSSHSGTQKGFPCGNMDFVEFIQGDAVTAGTVEYGFGGSGGCYRTN